MELVSYRNVEVEGFVIGVVEEPYLEQKRVLAHPEGLQRLQEEPFIAMYSISSLVWNVPKCKRN